jgi:O-antigen ligase
MTGRAEEAATRRAERPFVSSRIALLGVILVPAAIILAVASGAGGTMLVLGCAAAAVIWSLLDIRATLIVALLVATFVDYSAGHLTLEMAVLCTWLAWTLLLIFWRSTWADWTRSPAEMSAAIAVWLGACGLGVAIGLLHGNSLRNLGLELAAALWPALSLVVMQVYRRRSLAYAGWGLAGIALIHVVFGLTMLQIYQHRLGGVYFMTTTGIVAVGLWAAALLAPRRRIRALCLVAMIPMLAHLIFSFTRGYWLGAIAGIAVATLLSWRSLGKFEPAKRSRRLLLIPALLVVLSVTAGLSTLYFGRGDLVSSVGRRFNASFSTELSGETLSNVIRLLEYDRAIHAALESPILGKGLGYAFVTRDPLTGETREQWFVHNYYLLLWLKLGIVGLAAFAYLIARLIQAGVRTAQDDSSWLARAWAVAAVAVTCQVLVILLTNYSLADVNTAFVLAYVWGVFGAIRANPELLQPGSGSASSGGERRGRVRGF